MESGQPDPNGSPRAGGKRRVRCDSDDSGTTVNMPSGRQTRSVKQCFMHTKYFMIQASLIAMVLSGTATTFSGLPSSAEELHTTHLSAAQFDRFIREFAEDWSGFSLSTSFSGIDSPANAAHSISAFVSHHLGKPMDWINRWAIEKDNKAKSELMNSPHLFCKLMNMSLEL